MRRAAISPNALDISAIAVSGLCLVHCLSLPLLSVVLPMAGVFGEAEWLHQLFVLAALFITTIAIVQTRPVEGQREFAVIATIALAILLSAAFLEALHDFETILTVAGASLLALAHGLRWQRRTKN